MSMRHPATLIPASVYESLSKRHRLFLKYYLESNFNIKYAAKKAGYSSISVYQTANRILEKPAVRAAFRELLENVKVDTQELLARYINIALFDPSEYLNVKTIEGVQYLEYDLERLQADGLGYMIKSIKKERNGFIHVEFLDREKALYQLSKISGLLNDNVTNLKIVTKVLPKEAYDQI